MIIRTRSSNSSRTNSRNVLANNAQSTMKDLRSTSTMSSNPEHEDRNQLLSSQPQPNSNKSKRARKDDTGENEDVSIVFIFQNKNSKHNDGDHEIYEYHGHRWVSSWRRGVWIVSIGFFVTVLVATYLNDQHRTALLRQRKRFPSNNNNNNNNNTMVTVPWTTDYSDNTYTATIEFCQNGNKNYGYRLPAEPNETTTSPPSTCFPAGIVLRVQPGLQYKLQVCNRASNAAVTNLHFHGLHLPNDTSEPVPPGECNQIVLDIPETHMGGTFYFHSHAHPNSFEQVAGGAYSMLIVEEQANLLEHVTDPKEAVQIFNWIQNERLILVSSHVEMGDDNNEQPAVLGNGLPGGLATVNVIANTWYRFRVAAVDPTGQRETLKIHHNCEAHPVAFDGIWRHSIVQPSRTNTQQEFSLTGASRIDLAVRCKHVGKFPVTWSDAPVANIVVGKAPRKVDSIDYASPFLDRAWRPSRPEYVQDLATLMDHDDLYRFDVPALHDKSHGFGDNAMGTPLLEMPLHSFQEWSISESQHHPFHLHVFPMQTFGCQGHVDGEFYDTVMSTSTQQPEKESCRVRFHIDVPGPIMMHCHSLHDTDAGKAMAVMKVVDMNTRQ